MSTVKTAKGTELPLLKLQGKDYLQVQHRVLWAREEHPQWNFQTEFLKLEEFIAVCRATIRDENGAILAQGTKSETPKGFADFIEKAESGAIGRALAFCGYGTQFAQELEEGPRLADSPSPPKRSELAQAANSNADWSQYVIQMGKKFKGQMLKDCDIYALADFSKWLSEQGDLKGVGLETRDAIEAFLSTRKPGAKR